MSQELQQPVHPDLSEFFEEFGGELETCNPNAYDELLAIKEGKGDKEKIEDFIYFYADELDACHPDAFDELNKILSQHGFEMW